jgi:hypothetical protein
MAPRGLGSVHLLNLRNHPCGSHRTVWRTLCGRGYSCAQTIGPSTGHVEEREPPQVVGGHGSHQRSQHNRHNRQWPHRNDVKTGAFCGWVRLGGDARNRRCP